MDNIQGTGQYVHSCIFCSKISAQEAESAAQYYIDKLREDALDRYRQFIIKSQIEGIEQENKALLRNTAGLMDGYSEIYDLRFDILLKDYRGLDCQSMGGKPHNRFTDNKFYI